MQSSNPRSTRTVHRSVRQIITIAILTATLNTSAHADERALFKPLPKDAGTTQYPVSPERVALGKKLFNDTLLSKSKKISCNSCHTLSNFGVDNEPTSLGHEGHRGGRNSPSVYNAALHIAQFWDGRAADVEAQALGPILNPGEMAMPDEATVVQRLREDKDYPALFRKAFPSEKEPTTFANVGLAIGAFERTLMTPSRFDSYLAGDDSALTTEEKAGLKTFVATGCGACHNGVTVGGGMYQKLGLVVPYQTTDLGRFSITKNEADRFVFKVPSLRNSEKTAPYFHDGSVATLEEAVRLMGKHQLGRDLSQEDTASIVTFLRSLTGKLPADVS
jgi:cytochrome c peroxidase